MAPRYEQIESELELTAKIQDYLNANDDLKCIVKCKTWLKYKSTMIYYLGYSQQQVYMSD